MDKKKTSSLQINEFYLKWMKPLKETLQVNLGGGPKVIQLRNIINLQKGLTGLYVLCLMQYYNRWNFSSYIYLANHGTYGLIWILKDQIIPDKSWDVYVTIPSALAAILVLLGYWIAPYIVVAHDVQVSAFRAAICIFLHTLGCVLMMASDTQKYYTLKYKKGLISDGFFTTCRNTNYFGEIMLYSSYAILAQHPLPWIVNSFMWIVVFITNMIVKDESLKKKDGADQYFQTSNMLIPKFSSISFNIKKKD